MTKDERMEFGQAHAPAEVNPPVHKCPICKDKTTLLIRRSFGRVCEDCAPAADQWQEVLDLVRDPGMPAAWVKCDGCGVDYHYQVVHVFRDSILCHKCHDAAKAADNAKPLMLGEVEVKAAGGASEYWEHPGIRVSHSAHNKCLEVAFFASGRMGKQKNFYFLLNRLIDGSIELSTGGVKKCSIPLAEWQAFIDQVEVHISGVSQNTVKLTPELIKMARDVIAHRRKAPTDAEWRAETTVHSFDDPGQLAVIKQARIDDGKRFAHDWLLQIFCDWLKDETSETWQHMFDVSAETYIKATGGDPDGEMSIPNDFDRLMPRYRYSLVLANLTPEQRERNRDWRPAGSGTKRYNEQNELSAVLQAAKSGIKPQTMPGPIGGWPAGYPAGELPHQPPQEAPQPSPEPRSDAQPSTPVVLPQALQSMSEIIDADRRSRIVDHEGKPIGEFKIATTSGAVDNKKVIELIKTIKAALAQPNDTAAQILPDGYYLRRSDRGIFVHLAHPNHPNHITVGMMPPGSTRLEFVSNIGELRRYMLKVVEGPRPPKHPSFQPIDREEKAA